MTSRATRPVQEPRPVTPTRSACDSPRPTPTSRPSQPPKRSCPPTNSSSNAHANATDWLDTESMPDLDAAAIILVLNRHGVRSIRIKVMAQPTCTCATSSWPGRAAIPPTRCRQVDRPKRPRRGRRRARPAADAAVARGRSPSRRAERWSAPARRRVPHVCLVPDPHRHRCTA